MLESDEAARRLGVKVTTLYAYVSRGLLTSHPSAVGRRSLFDMMRSSVWLVGPARARRWRPGWPPSPPGSPS